MDEYRTRSQRGEVTPLGTTTAQPAQALTFDEVQERLAVGRTTLFRLVETGQLPSVKIGRSRRFLAEDVDAYLRGLRQAS